MRGRASGQPGPPLGTHSPCAQTLLSVTLHSSLFPGKAGRRLLRVYEETPKRHPTSCFHFFPKEGRREAHGFEETALDFQGHDVPGGRTYASDQRARPWRSRCTVRSTRHKRPVCPTGAQWMERGQKQQLPEKATLSAATPHALSKRSLSPDGPDPAPQRPPDGQGGAGRGRLSASLGPHGTLDVSTCT